MELLPFSHPFQDRLESSRASFGFFGGLETICDRVYIRLIEGIEKHL